MLEPSLAKKRNKSIAIVLIVRISLLLILWFSAFVFPDTLILIVVLIDACFSYFLLKQKEVINLFYWWVIFNLLFWGVQNLASHAWGVFAPSLVVNGYFVYLTKFALTEAKLRKANLALVPVVILFTLIAIFI